MGAWPAAPNCFASSFEASSSSNGSAGTGRALTYFAGDMKCGLCVQPSVVIEEYVIAPEIDALGIDIGYLQRGKFDPATLTDLMMIIGIGFGIVGAAHAVATPVNAPRTRATASSPSVTRPISLSTRAARKLRPIWVIASG